MGIAALICSLVTTFTLVLLTVLGVGGQLALTARSRPRSCSPR